MYVCMCVSVSICKHVCVYTVTTLCIRMFTQVNTHCLFMSTHVCIYICTYKYKYKYIYIYIYMCSSLCACVYTLGSCIHS